MKILFYEIIKTVDIKQDQIVYQIHLTKKQRTKAKNVTMSSHPFLRFAACDMLAGLEDNFPFNITTLKKS